MRDLLKQYGGFIRRKHVVSLHAIGVQAVELIKEHLEKALASPIAFEHLDVVATPVVRDPIGTNPKRTRRDVFLEASFSPGYTQGLARVITRLTFWGEEGTLTWKPAAITIDLRGVQGPDGLVSFGITYEGKQPLYMYAKR